MFVVAFNVQSCLPVACLNPEIVSKINEHGWVQMQVMTIQHKGQVVPRMADSRHAQRRQRYQQALQQLLALDCKNEEAVHRFFMSIKIEI